MNDDEKLVTVGLRVPERVQREVDGIARLLHVKPSEIFRWMFEAGWSEKDRVVRAKAAALLSFLGEELPERRRTDRDAR